MENVNAKPERRERFYLRILTANKFAPLFGKDNRICYFSTLAAARAYMPTVLQHIECDGIQVATERYWV